MRPLARGDDEVAFWVRHARIGVLLTLACGFSTVGYLLAATPTRGRGGLVALVAGSVTLTPLVWFLPIGRIVRHPLGALFFYAWSTLVVTIVTAGAALDGGIASPLFWVNTLALAYAAIAYPPAGILLVGAEAIGLAIVVEVLQPSADGPPRAVLTLVILALFTLLCALAARGHWRQYEEQSGLAQRFAELAHSDALTGCANHRAFHDRLGAEVERARRSGAALALLVADLDHFKDVNDRFGHPAGDAVLAALGTCLRRIARAGDTVARIGGEEFALLLPETDLDEARAVAERIRLAARQIPAPVTISLSVGVAANPGGALPGATLLAQADAALYEAKRAGRDRVLTHPAL